MNAKDDKAVPQIETDPRFAWIEKHGGPLVGWVVREHGSRHGVAGEGLSPDWFSSFYDSTQHSPHLGIDKHVKTDHGTRMLSVSLNQHPSGDDGPVRWSCTLNVGEGRYVRAGGTAEDFVRAVAAAESHKLETRAVSGLTWWCEGLDRWVAWVGPFALKATRIQYSTDTEPWYFEICGNAPSFEEAAILAALGRAG